MGYTHTRTITCTNDIAANRMAAAESSVCQGRLVVVTLQLAQKDSPFLTLLAHIVPSQLNVTCSSAIRWRCRHNVSRQIINSNT